MSIRLSDLAHQHELELVGDDVDIRGINTLAAAGPQDLSFFANPGYRDALRSTRSAAVILRRRDLDDCPSRGLVSDDPYLSFARIARQFDQRPALASGIHPQASIADDVRLGNDVGIGANAVIEPGVVLGDGVQIGPGAVLQSGSTVGRGCRIHAGVTVRDGVIIGERVTIHPGAVIGADGFGLAFGDSGWEKVPQLGTVRIGDDCEIGANTTIDRGALGDTVLEEDVRLDNQVQVAHNVHIGAHTAVAGCTGIAGSTRIGRYCLIAGAAGIGGHLEICDKVTITAMSPVLRDITEPGEYGSAIPAMPQRRWQRTLVRLLQLNKRKKRRRNSS